MPAFRYECLQRVTLDGQTQTRHRGEHACIPGHDDADLRRINRAARRFYAGDLAALPVNSRHLALLDDIHAASIRSTRKPPRNRVVACDAGTTLQRSAEYRVARLR